MILLLVKFRSLVGRLTAMIIWTVRADNLAERSRGIAFPGSATSITSL